MHILSLTSLARESPQLHRERNRFAPNWQTRFELI